MTPTPNWDKIPKWCREPIKASAQPWVHSPPVGMVASLIPPRAGELLEGREMANPVKQPRSSQVIFY